MSQQENNVPSKSTDDQLTADEFNDVASVQNANSQDSETRLTANETALDGKAALDEPNEFTEPNTFIQSSDFRYYMTSNFGLVIETSVGFPTSPIPLLVRKNSQPLLIAEDTGIGIRNESPSEALDVVGNIQATGTVTGSNLTNLDNTSDADKPVSTATQLELDAKAGLAANNVFTGFQTFESSISNAGGITVDTTSPVVVPLTIERLGSVVLTVSNASRVGIGIAAPAEMLDVDGNIQATGTVTVENDIEVVSSLAGVVLESPNGTKYRVQVDDTGTLTTTAI